MKQSKLRKIFATLLAVVMILCVMPLGTLAQNDGGQQFRDVASNAWFANAVAYCYENGLMVGVSDTEFDPNGTVTREMVVSVLYRIAETPDVEIAEGETAVGGFADVAAGKWYSKAILWGKENEIVYGLTETQFGIGEAVTREQMTAFLYRFAEKWGCDISGKDDLAAFADADNIRAYAVDSVKWAVKSGFISGSPADGKTYLLPRDSAKRAELASVLMRYMKNVIGELVGSILYTNDVHTYLDKALSYVSVGGLKNLLNEEGLPTLLVDAGDHIQGTAYGSMDKGESIIKLMNAAGYDLATLGNHEFDYDMPRLKELVAMAEYPYVSANFYHETDGVRGERVLDAYKVFELGGMKIAFVGITTPESFTKSTPKYFQDESGNYIYDIAGGTDGQDLYASVQTAIDAAKAEADIVVALGHLGIDEASKPWTSRELITNTTGLSAFIDGHSHSTVENETVLDKDGNRVFLTQTGSYFDAIGFMTVYTNGEVDCGLLRHEDFPADEWASIDTRADAKVGEILNAWKQSVDTRLGEVIGYSEVTLDNYDSGKRLVRSEETNTGDFAADALYYLFDNLGYAVDVAIMNGGGVRNKAVSGELSYKSLKDIHTFGNVACLQIVTGQQIKDALEFGSRAVPGELGGFLQVSGLHYTIDPSVQSTVQLDEKSVWAGGPTGEYRVSNIEIYDRESKSYVPLQLDKKYMLAGYNYTLRDLGDGFAMFRGAENVIDYVMEDYMVLANYVKSFPVNSGTGLPTIAADHPIYANLRGEGRITIK